MSKQYKWAKASEVPLPIGSTGDRMNILFEDEPEVLAWDDIVWRFSTGEAVQDDEMSYIDWLVPVEYPITEEDVIAAANYGLKYATTSQHTGEVPRGNTLQWLYTRQEREGYVSPIPTDTTDFRYKLVLVQGITYLIAGDDFHNRNLNDGDTAYHWKTKQIGIVTEQNNETGTWKFTTGYPLETVTDRDSYKLCKVVWSSDQKYQNDYNTTDLIYYGKHILNSISKTFTERKHQYQDLPMASRIVIDQFAESILSYPLPDIPSRIDRNVNFDDLDDKIKVVFVDMARALITSDLYFCGRVWDAWWAGTMTEDDFSPAQRDENFIYSIARMLYTVKTNQR